MYVLAPVSMKASLAPRPRAQLIVTAIDTPTPQRHTVDTDSLRCRRIPTHVSTPPPPHVPLPAPRLHTPASQISRSTNFVTTFNVMIVLNVFCENVPQILAEKLYLRNFFAALFLQKFNKTSLLQ